MGGRQGAGWKEGGGLNRAVWKALLRRATKGMGVGGGGGRWGWEVEGRPVAFIHMGNSAPEGTAFAKPWRQELQVLGVCVRGGGGLGCNEELGVPGGEVREAGQVT